MSTVGGFSLNRLMRILAKTGLYGSGKNGAKVKA